jgi:hypothetical protein
MTRRWRRWAIPVGLTIAGAILATGIYFVTRDLRIVAVFALAPIIGAVGGILYGKRASREIVALLFGMGVGGGDWALIAIIVEPRSQLVSFLQGHAFDYFTAAGLAGFTLYLLEPDRASAHPRLRDVWVVASLTVIAATTAFSTGATPDMLLRTVAASLLCGSIVVVLMRALLPASTPR